MKSGIYKIENIINKKYYIGQSEDLEIRIKEHKYAPVNAQNDPYGLNEFWVSGVRAFYNSI